MTRLFLLICIFTLISCAGSPMRLASMTPEELSYEHPLNLCNTYHFNKNKNVRDELELRDLLSDNEWNLIDANSIQRGMSELALICLRGAIVPGYGSINVTTGSWGVHKQYVYEHPLGGRSYVYVENGKVTSWQY
jgi:hypothetical protein